MPTEKRVIPNAIVLKLAPTGEKFTQARILSQELGLLSVLKRNRTKANGFSIDLFDQGEAHVDHKPGEGTHNGFLTDFVTTQKRSGIGKSYPALQAASWLSGLLIANPIHEHNQDETFVLAHRAFNSLAEGQAPIATMLKTLYVFARDEGYPVLEDWARKLPPSLSSQVTHILNTPLSDIALGKEEQQGAFSSLAHYIEFNTHIHLPAK